MTQAANVRSLDAIRDFRSALIKFIDKAKRAISTGDSEVQHTHSWLGSTQPMHWLHEIRRSEEHLAQAKSELFRATISQPDNPRGPTDQVRLVRKRQGEIKHSQDKLEQTKRWSRTFERETNEYRSSLTPLSSSLDGSLNKAVVLLDKAIQTLEAYLASSVPTTEEETTSTQQLESIARKGKDDKENQTDEHADSDSTTDKSN